MRNFGFEPKPDPFEPTRSPPSSPPPPPAASRAERKAPEAKKVAVLGATLRFKGELSAEEDFILQGRIEGSINHTQSVTIGTDGAVVGDIHARVVIIDGSVEGDLHAIDAVHVNQTGRVTGNIFAPRVALVDGAFFSGRIDMGEARTAAARPAASRVQHTAPGEPLSVEETQKMLGIKL